MPFSSPGILKSALRNTKSYSSLVLIDAQIFVNRDNFNFKDIHLTRDMSNDKSKDGTYSTSTQILDTKLCLIGHIIFRHKRKAAEKLHLAFETTNEPRINRLNGEEKSDMKLLP